MIYGQYIELEVGTMTKNTNIDKVTAEFTMGNVEKVDD